ncbi:hypothetical protein SteCoe_12901 [Stentor coeruleus]|uniref:Uncharacterized protein n=1 Tax=Stentor coeruleus TaxID=5963 RepID=A0A1R2C9M0_9CILI|nr:hypothetical protein SteCoe_12901 [Stentor coeruleus]
MRKANSSSQRDSFLNPKIVDPLTLPKYTRARVCPSDRLEKSPIRKGKGHFYAFNQTSEEESIKFTRKRIDQVQHEEAIQKSKKLFSYTATDTIINPNSDIIQQKKTKTFKPSQELIKYNESRIKIPRKVSNSPVETKKSAMTERNYSIPSMEYVMKTPFEIPDKVTKKPGEIPFGTLKKVVKGNYKANSIF